MRPLCHRRCLLPIKVRQKETLAANTRVTEKDVCKNKLSVLTAHGGKQDQCHCWDFLICSCCCCGATGDAHSTSNYCHLFRRILLGYVSLLLSKRRSDPNGWTSARCLCAILVQSEGKASCFQPTRGDCFVLPQRSQYRQRHPACQMQASG